MAEPGSSRQSRGLARRFVVVAGALALAGCGTVVPRTGPRPVPAPRPAPPPPPSVQVPQPVQGLPEDNERNRVAVLVPLTGPNAGVGTSLANAANLAILDTGGAHVRLTVYDTGPGAAAAAEKALADGNRLILGPLFAEDVTAVAGVARRAGVPVVSFSNDVSVAGGDVFIMGFTPTQSVDRVMAYARSRGVARVAGLVPAGVYGRRASSAFLHAAEEDGITVAAIQNYDRTAASLRVAVGKLGGRGAYDAVMVMDTGGMALAAAPAIRKAAGPDPRLLGTELWATDPGLARAPVMAGAWYAAVSDATFAKLSQRYRARFGHTPYRLASLSYDAVLLTVQIANGWRAGDPFPVRALTDRGGFTGVDGAFRFRDGVAERALEVRQLGEGVVSPAPVGFER